MIKPLSLRHGDFALNRIAFAYAHSAAYSLTSAMQLWQLRRGGHSRANRRTYAITAVSAGPAANQFCQFGGFTRASRLPIQREICNNWHKCEASSGVKNDHHCRSRW